MAGGRGGAGPVGPEAVLQRVRRFVGCRFLPTCSCPGGCAAAAGATRTRTLSVVGLAQREVGRRGASNHAPQIAVRLTGTPGLGQALPCGLLRFEARRRRRQNVGALRLRAVCGEVDELAVGGETACFSARFDENKCHRLSAAGCSPCDAVESWSRGAGGGRRLLSALH